MKSDAWSELGTHATEIISLTREITQKHLKAEEENGHGNPPFRPAASQAH